MSVIAGTAPLRRPPRTEPPAQGATAAGAARGSVGRRAIVRAVALVVLAVAVLAGCAGKQVVLRYEPDPTLERLPNAHALSQALAAGFTARGVPVTIAYQPFASRVTSFATPYALTGEIENFSTEVRFGVQAHVSGIVRLQDRDGGILVEKRISERRIWGVGSGAVTSDDPLEGMLNGALAGFVAKVVNEPELTGVLTRP